MICMNAKAAFGASAAALVTAAAVMAQPAARRDSAVDANRKICRAMSDVGSRLSRSRACHTAAEWAELRRQMKQNVDHIQNARAWNVGCGPSGSDC